MSPRPLIAVPARFSVSAAALRYAAEVNARALIEAVWRAGGEPVALHPHAPGGVAEPSEVAGRLARFDGLLLPGGGDLAPYRYGAVEAHDSVYDVDDEQDAFDLELARCALRSGVPLLAVCRGLHVVNTVLGGTLDQDIDGHRHVRHPVAVAGGSVLGGLAGAEKAEASCYHHQRVARLGEGLTVVARAADGTVEGVELAGGAGWFVGVQWHPEDTAGEDAGQRGIFEGLVRAARCRGV
ncbi:gamma-glutamyl-gamma-aminobutyrate hydrolase family protein [Streptomyces sp. 4F14]|uniref:gamma-glutamyl-gamma-aminobutyrate hydrolase family protein n=1 Tax=Streptomyces sp. 4F14 TaxID=3394380 RepID=UPI003A87FC94